jgi:serine O-acetyltransferase
LNSHPPATPLPFLASIRADLAAHLPPELRGGPRSSRVRRALAIVLGSTGFHVTCLYRSGHALRSRFGLAGRVASSLVSWTIRHAYGCSIAPTARLEGGLILPHPIGIVIGPGVEVGPRAWIFQNVTLGGSPGREGMPKVGPDARIWPGAVLAGPIKVGANVVIGANAVVTVDVPDHTLVRTPSPSFSPLSDHFRVDS